MRFLIVKFVEQQIICFFSKQSALYTRDNSYIEKYSNDSYYNLFAKVIINYKGYDLLYYINFYPQHLLKKDNMNDFFIYMLLLIISLYFVFIIISLLQERIVLFTLFHILLFFRHAIIRAFPYYIPNYFTLAF